MSDSSGEAWSDNPNAPQIPYELYFVEKAALAGTFLAIISYGNSAPVPAHSCSHFLFDLHF